MRVDDDVGRLQITVHDSRLVRVVQCIGDFGAKCRRFARRQRLDPQPLFQRAALDEVADDVGFAVDPAGFVDARDAGVIQLSRGARFAQKLFRFGGGQASLVRHFDHDHSVQFAIPRLPDGAETSGTDALQQLEAAERCFRIRAFVDQAEVDVATGTFRIAQIGAGRDAHLLMALGTIQPDAGRFGRRLHGDLQQAAPAESGRASVRDRQIALGTVPRVGHRAPRLARVLCAASRSCASRNCELSGDWCN